QPEDPFDVGPGHALVSGSGEEIYKNPKPQEEGRPSASLYNAASRALGQAIGGEFQNGVFTGTTPGKTEWFLNAQEVSHNLVDQGVNPGQAAQLAYTQTRKQVPQISDWEAKAQAKKQLEQEQAQQIGSKWNPANWGDWWNAPDISQQQIQDRANLIQDRSKPAYQGATDALGMGSGPGSMPRDQGSGVPSRSGAAGQKSAPVAEQAGQGEQPKKNRATQVRKIPEEAIRQLKKNPSKKMKQYFDEAFGDGAADYVLSEE
ncbi:MAG TPA: hypothetical protein VKA48_05940, partial [Gammaproteobacteria bacterium]|nr:hypothetical protein [Gammaproteobacteria bacterium]